MGKNTKRQYDLLVIGAGASGMMAAITAARENKKVCILEKLDKAGKKLLATGNGKCNFTNANMSSDYFGGDSSFVSQILEQFSVSDCLDFFNSIGVYPKNKNGYYYPNSEQSSSVVNALLEELVRKNVNIFYDTQVLDILPLKENVIVSTNKENFSAKKIIVATGLLAAPKLGSDGSVLEIIKRLGHHFVPILPVLCGYYAKGISFKKVSGVRTTGTVTAIVDGKNVAEDTGEIQFTDYGISGIPVFQISRYLSKGLYQKSEVKVDINLLPGLNKEQLINELNRRKAIKNSQPASTLLNGLINQKLSDVVLEKANIDVNLLVSSLSESQICRIAGVLQKITVSITKHRDYEFAQVCTGGISTSDIIWETLESKFVPNIHFTGEILDVDGICGGYNLHFAWATGFLAAKSICKSLKD